MAVDCGKFILPIKCFECKYATVVRSLTVGTSIKSYNVSLRALCPRTAGGLLYHKKLILLGKRDKGCMVKENVKVV